MAHKTNKLKGNGMSNAIGFINWYKERCGHPTQIKTAYSVITEQQEEIKALKVSIANAKSNALSDMAETLKEAGAPNQIEAAVRTHNSICNILEKVAQQLRDNAK